MGYQPEIEDDRRGNKGDDGPPKLHSSPLLLQVSAHTCCRFQSKGAAPGEHDPVAVFDRGQRMQEPGVPAARSGPANVHSADGRVIDQHGRATGGVLKIGVVADRYARDVGDPAQGWIFGRRRGVWRSGS